MGRSEKSALDDSMRLLLPVITVAIGCGVLIQAAAVPKVMSVDAKLSPEEVEEAAELAKIKAYEDSKKYFHEPGNTDLLGHYDTRFYKGLLSYEDKRDTQVHMIRAYLDTFRENGIETWISHGTLLGWWWNGKVCLLIGCGLLGQTPLTNSADI